MVYMLFPAMSAGHLPAMAMGGMNGPGAAGNPAIALVLAVFILGYVLWNTDRLATLSRPGAAASPHHGAARLASAVAASAGAEGATQSSSAVSLAGSAASAALAPRFAAAYKIAMSIAMGYMLITML